jgi:hypothetical protein
MHIIDHGNRVPGLLVVEDIVTEQEEEYLVSSIDQETWSGLGIG